MPSTGPGAERPAAQLFTDLAAVVDGRKAPQEALFARIADAARVQEVMDRVSQKGERVIGR